MQLAEMQHIPLGQAFLCADCASVGNSSSGCPACSSTHIQSLANVLDRAHAPEDAASRKETCERPHD